MTIAPLIEEIARASGFQDTIAEAMRELTLHAGVLEAMDNSGYRSALYAVAAQHHGLVTTEMARAVGVPSVEVRKLAAPARLVASGRTSPHTSKSCTPERTPRTSPSTTASHL